MKTTVELPDELLRAVKVRAATENRRLKDVLAEVIAAGLGSESVPGRVTVRNRVRLPLIKGGHAARADEEVTPERAAEVLIQQEAKWSRR